MKHFKPADTKLETGNTYNRCLDNKMNTFSDNHHDKKIFLITLTVLVFTGLSSAAVTSITSVTASDIETGQNSVDQETLFTPELDTNESEETITIDASSLPSEVSISSTSASIASSNSLEVSSGASYDSGAEEISIGVNDSNVNDTDEEVNLTVTYDTSGINTGVSDISLPVTAVSGSGSSTQVFDIVDVTPPEVSSYTVDASGQDVSVSFDTDETLSAVSVDVSGAETSTLSGIGEDFSETDNGDGSYTYEATYTGSSDGEYTLTLDTATDSASNDGANSQSGTETVDTTSPSFERVKIMDETNTNGVVAEDDNVKISANISDSGTISSVSYNASSFNGGTGTLSESAGASDYTGSFTVGAPENDGSKTVELDATDGAGNGGDQNFESGSLTVDNSAPIINQQASVAISTDSNGNSVLNKGDTFTVSVTASDLVSGIKSVQADLSNLNMGQKTLSAASGDVYNSTFTLSENSYEIDEFTPSVAVVDLGANPELSSPETGIKVDSKAPTITRSSTEIVLESDKNSNGIANPGDTVKVTWDSSVDGVTDIKSVKVNFSNLGGSVLEAKDSNSDEIYNASFEVGNGTVDGSVHSYITVTDTADNSQSIDTAEINVDNSIPVKPEYLTATPIKDGDMEVEWKVPGNSFQQKWFMGNISADVTTLNGYKNQIFLGSEYGIQIFDDNLNELYNVQLEGAATRDISVFDGGMAVIHGYPSYSHVSVITKDTESWSVDWTQTWSDGKKWKGVHRVAVDESNNFVYVGAGAGYYYSNDADPGIFRVNLETGNVDKNWSYQQIKGQIRGLEYDETTDDLFFGTSKNETYRLDPENEELVWKKRVGGQIGSVKVDENSVYLGQGGHMDTNKGASLTRRFKENGSIKQVNGEEWIYYGFTELIRTLHITDNYVYGGSGTYEGSQSINKIEKSSLDTVWDTSMKENVAGLHVYQNQVFSSINWYASNVSIYNADNGNYRESKSGVIEGKSGHNGDVTDVAVDSDNYVYTSGGYDSEKLIRSYPNGTNEWSFNGHSNNIVSLDLGSNGHVYTASRDKTVKKVLADQGTEIWSVSLNKEPQDVKVDSSGYVYTAPSDYNGGSLKKLNPDGTEAWTFNGYNRQDEEVYAIDIGPNGNIYTVSGDYDYGMIRVITPDGTELNSYEAGNDRMEDIAVDSNENIYALNGDYLWKFNRDGTSEWKFGEGSYYDDSLMLDSNEDIYLGDYGTLIKISKDGNELWRESLHSNSITGTDLDGEGNIYTSSDETVRKTGLYPAHDVQYRKESDENWKTLASRVFNTKTVHRNTQNNTTYNYRVRTTDQANNTGIFSNTASATTDATNPIVESVEVFDRDKNGNIDAIQVNYSENVKNLGKNDFDILATIDRRTENSVTYNPNVVNMTSGMENPVRPEYPGTSLKSKIRFNEGLVKDMAGNNLSAVNFTDIIDSADPVIQFSEGKNMVSFPSKVGTYSLDQLLDNPENVKTDSIDAVWTYNGKWESYKPGRNSSLNDFNSVEGGTGYILTASSDGKIVANIDTANEEDRNPSGLSLDKERWNLAGYYYERPVNSFLRNSQAPIGDFRKKIGLNHSISQVIVRDSTGSFRQANSTDLKPGGAYWVSALENQLYEPKFSQMINEKEDDSEEVLK